MDPVVIGWSGGKDSCMALHEVQRSGDHTVVGLMTTVTRDYDRISMHGVRRTLLARQAQSLGLPLQEVFIRAGASNADYEAAMAEALVQQPPATAERGTSRASARPASPSILDVEP